MIVLHNIHTINEGVKNITIKDGKIISVSSAVRNFTNNSNNTACLHLHFDNAFSFPGLINSHDHLEFNLFPQLGNFIYKNYLDWGPDIHQQNKEIINAVLQVPKERRIQWGIYKNLLNGITTVVHHGEHLQINNAPINIFQDSHSLHSVGLEKNWRLKLNRPFVKDQPFVIHIGEGTDDIASNEVNKLIRWNILKRKLVGVHGVAMNEGQAKSFEALIWCPDSNFFLLNATAKINELKKETKILFGTDSTLSASWNIWDQLRLARSTNMLNDKELFDSLTCTPALVWNLPETSFIAENNKADLVVAKMKNSTNRLESLFLLNPEDIILVIRSGTIILFDETLYSQLAKNILVNDFSKIFINNTGKYVLGDLPALIKLVKEYAPEAKFPVEIE
jgi:cytosine/adenosine deaminase-related metal-dependent hydrolase